MDYNEITLTAGQWYDLPVTGHYMRLLNGEGVFRVSTDTGIRTDWIAGIGGRFTDANDGDPFQRLSLKSPTAQTVKVITSHFPIADSRLTGDVDVNGLLSVVNAGGASRTLSATTLTAGAATQVLAQNTDRLKALIHVEGPDQIYLGIDNTVTDSGATRGIPLTSGSDWLDENTNELWAYLPAAASCSVIVMADIK